MTNLVELPKPASISISNQPDLFFPVNRIYCIGLNYTAHAQEIYQSTEKTKTFFFFTKPQNAILHNHQSIVHPMKTTSFQHEVELVIAIGKPGKCISAENAEQHIYGFATGIDFTRRDLQKHLSKSGLPWDAGKVFDGSAAISSITPLSATGGIITKGAIRLKVNGTTKQQADISQMLFNIRAIIAELSQYNPLRQGDIIYTGTPQGTSNLKPGDKITAHIDGLEDLNISVCLPEPV